MITLRTNLWILKALLLVACAVGPGCTGEAGDAASASALVSSTAPGASPAGGPMGSGVLGSSAGGPVATTAAALFLPPPGPDDHGNAPTAATPLIVGDVVSGRLEGPDDVDWFSVTLDPGTPLRCAIHAYGEVRLTLLDRSGAQVLGEGAPRGPALTWTPRAPGTFYLRVEAAAGQGMDYTLDATAP